MKLDGRIAYEVLAGKGVSYLFHVNTVKTASSFVFAGGLLSRSMVEKIGLEQTEQYTDTSDKQFGIWNDIFLDSTDYHRRINDRNKYGPVLFKIKSEVLLLDNIDVKVTFSNPSKWSFADTSSWYFDTGEELDKNFSVGTFDYILTLHDFSSVLPFSEFLSDILIDCPCESDEWKDFCRKIQDHLLERSRQGGVFVLPREKVKIRDCSGYGCKCSKSYSSLDAATREKLFRY